MSFYPCQLTQERRKGSGNSKAVGFRVAIIACPRSSFLAYLPVVAAVSIEKWAKRGPQRHSGGKMNHEFLLSSSLRRLLQNCHAGNCMRVFAAFCIHLALSTSTQGVEGGK